MATQTRYFFWALRQRIKRQRALERVCEQQQRYSAELARVRKEQEQCMNWAIEIFYDNGHYQRNRIGGHRESVARLTKGVMKLETVVGVRVTRLTDSYVIFRWTRERV